MNSTTRFSNRVEDYVKYRPSYPPEVIEFLRESGLNEYSIVADVGSGTGIFAKLLLETGCTVYGVEPNAAMRAAGDDFLRKFDKFESCLGTAETTGLLDASVDFISAAQAFHWFEGEKTKTEFRRILRPDGFVVLIWNERKPDADAFSVDYGRFLREHGEDYEKIRLSHAHQATIETFFDSDFNIKSFANSQTLDLAGLQGRTLSSSFMPTAEDADFPTINAALERVFAQHQQAGGVTIFYDTKVFYKQFKK